MLFKAVQPGEYTRLLEAGTAELAKTQSNTSMAKSSNQLIE